MLRSNNRTNSDTRNIFFQKPIQTSTDGSVIINTGNTIVNCSVTIENKVPRFINPEESGWLTCEYSMLPQATPSRVTREASRGKQTGRTVEIQRLIGRSLRAITDLSKIPGKTIWIDCDVLQADGGTRTAAISGASVALNIALSKLLNQNIIECSPQVEHVSAISLGIVKGEILLDIDYQEDSNADVDMNLIMTESGKFVEVQMSAEGNVFSEQEMNQLISLGKTGINKMIKLQSDYLSRACPIFL